MELLGDFQRPTIAPELRQAAAAATTWQQQQTPRLPQSTAAEYDGITERMDAWLDQLFMVRREHLDQPRLARVILDSSHQGSGKSHSVPELAWRSTCEQHPGGDERATTNLIYVSRNYRSPSIEEIAVRFKELPSRNLGVIYDQAPSGEVIRRTITLKELRDGVIPDEPATCVYAHKLQSLTSRGFGYKLAVEDFCKDRCPHRPRREDGEGGDGSCIHRANTAAFYIKPEGGAGMQEPGISTPRPRTGIEGLIGLANLCPTYLSKSVVFFDESDQLFDAAISSHNLTSERLGQLLAHVPVLFPLLADVEAGMFPELNAEVERDRNLTRQLLTTLMELLATTKARFGIDHHAIRQHLQPWIDSVIQTYGHGDDARLPHPWLLNSQQTLVQPYQVEDFITDASKDTPDAFPSPLLPQLVHCVLGLDAGASYDGYSLSITKIRSGNDATKPGNYRVTLTSPSNALRDIAAVADAVIVGDATADPDLIRRLFTTPDQPTVFRHIKAASVPKADQADVLFFQVKDMGAMTARQRRDHQTQRLLAIRQDIATWAAPLLNIPSDQVKAGFIEHKACAQPGDGKWHTASARGGNMFQQHDVLALVGKPIKNISAALSEYVALTGDASASTGCHPEENSPGFLRYQAQLVAAELQQAWERLRIIRRPGQRLIVLFISDADLSGLPIDVIQIQAADISPAAAHKTDQKLNAITQAICDLACQGVPLERISTRSVERVSGVNRTSIQRIAQHQSGGKPWIDFVLACLPAP
ncbi:MAG: hypothetical protein RLZZ631_1292 [Cyanobacteriota bacterium]|jgi:hypothetical protein